MNWIDLQSASQLTDIQNQSKEKYQLIFKHSTRCSISVMIKNRLEKSATPNGVDFYYLDLLQYRNISASIADMFHVYHESPQVLLIKNGECIYDESHNAISMDEISSMITA